MNVTHLLDTSVYSQPIRKKPLESVVRRWDRLGDERCAVSAICQAELLTGLKHRNSPKLWRAYESILKGRLLVIDVDATVAEHYSDLAAEGLKRGLPKPEFDLLIAASAKAHGLIVATCNAKHFRDLEGVAVEDWRTG